MKLNMTIEYPGYFARFYDLIYHHSRDGIDNRYYHEKINKAGGKILEVGVGTGRMFMDALNTGADIYGIDISPAMTEVLKNKLRPDQRDRITLQNITDFKTSDRYNLIIAPFRVFMHLEDMNDQIKALNNVYSHLIPGGEFVFDTFIPDLKQLICGLDKVTDFDGEYEPGNRIKRIVSTKPDLINQVINILFRFEWNEGEINYMKEWESRLRYFFRFELEHLIALSDFKNYRIFGDFYENEPDQNSREFVIVCKKKKKD